MPNLITDNKITFWPSLKQTDLRDQLFAFLIECFESNREYSELEVNMIIKNHHTFGDHVMLRRELFERGFLRRNVDGSRYWRA